MEIHLMINYFLKFDSYTNKCLLMVWETLNLTFSALKQFEKKWNIFVLIISTYSSLSTLFIAKHSSLKQIQRKTTMLPLVRSRIFLIFGQFLAVLQIWRAKIIGLNVCKYNPKIVKEKMSNSGEWFWWSKGL